MFELLTRKKVDQTFITRSDLQSYREILEATHGHLENNDPAGVIKTARGAKFKDVISKLFPTGGVTRREYFDETLDPLLKIKKKVCQAPDSNPQLLWLTATNSYGTSRTARQPVYKHKTL